MKAIASDFDGTLFFSDIDGYFKETDKKAIAQYQDQDQLFGLCTGRPLKGVQYLINDQIQLDFYILVSGALILDKQLHVIYKDCIKYETLKALFDAYQDQYDLFIQADDCCYTFGSSVAPFQEKIITSLEDVKDSDIYGISFSAKTVENAQIITDQINQNYEDITAFQNVEYVDVVKKGCSKGNAIAQLKSLMHIDLMAAIGDSYNDMSMLQTADHSFTFTYSPDIVKQEADEIVDHLSEAVDKMAKLGE